MIIPVKTRAILAYLADKYKQKMSYLSSINLVLAVKKK